MAVLPSGLNMKKNVADSRLISNTSNCGRSKESKLSVKSGTGLTRGRGCNRDAAPLAGSRQGKAI